MRADSLLLSDRDGENLYHPDHQPRVDRCEAPSEHGVGTIALP